MIPWITLGVTTLSLVITLFLLWVLKGPREEEATHAVGFRYDPPQEEEEDGSRPEDP